MESDILDHTHDLKNKITLISGNLRIVKRINKQPELEVPLNSIEAAATRTVGIIENLEGLVRGGQKVNSENVKLLGYIDELMTTLFRSLEKLYQVKIKHTKQQISIDSYVAIDKKLLHQVFENLVENAAQNQASQIGIDFIAYQRYLEIIIEDNGTGIKKGFLEKLGHETVSTKKKGGGRGTHIIVENIKNMQGKVKWFSEDGSKVQIILPLYSNQQVSNH